MSTFVTLSFELLEYAEDGETRKRHLRFESWENFARMNTDKGLRAEEIPAFQKIVDGLNELRALNK